MFVNFLRGSNIPKYLYTFLWCKVVTRAHEYVSQEITTLIIQKHSMCTQTSTHTHGSCRCGGFSCTSTCTQTFAHLYSSKHNACVYPSQHILVLIEIRMGKLKLFINVHFPIKNVLKMSVWHCGPSFQV